MNNIGSLYLRTFELLTNVVLVIGLLVVEVVVTVVGLVVVVTVVVVDGS